MTYSVINKLPDKLIDLQNHLLLYKPYLVVSLHDAVIPNDRNTPIFRSSIVNNRQSSPFKMNVFNHYKTGSIS